MKVWVTRRCSVVLNALSRWMFYSRSWPSSTELDVAAPARAAFLFVSSMLLHEHVKMLSRLWWWRWGCANGDTKSEAGNWHYPRFHSILLLLLLLLLLVVVVVEVAAAVRLTVRELQWLFAHVQELFCNNISLKCCVLNSGMICTDIKIQGKDQLGFMHYDLIRVPWWRSRVRWNM
jgi:hypothetical protein